MGWKEAPKRWSYTVRLVAASQREEVLRHGRKYLGFRATVATRTNRIERRDPMWQRCDFGRYLGPPRHTEGIHLVMKSDGSVMETGIPPLVIFCRHLGPIFFIKIEFCLFSMSTVDINSFCCLRLSSRNLLNSSAKVPSLVFASSSPASGDEVLFSVQLVQPALSSDAWAHDRLLSNSTDRVISSCCHLSDP